MTNSTAPLTLIERRQLTAKLKTMPRSMISEAVTGISLLPEQRRQRALLEWAQNTKAPTFVTCSKSNAPYQKR